MAAMTLLQIVTRTAKRLGLPVPTAAFSSTDATWKQGVEILVDLGEEIMAANDWSQMITPKTSVITLLNYTPIALPADYEKIIEGSKIWRPSVMGYLAGPITADRWQELTTYGLGYIPGAWRLFGGFLNIYGLNPAETVTWEYLSKYWIMDADNVTTKEFWTADTDYPRFPNRLMRLGLQWKWKRAKGFDYSQEKSDFEEMLETMISNDRGMMDIKLSSPRDDDIIMNDGTWPGMVTP